MASSGLVFVCLLIISLMLEAKSEKFVSVTCPESVVAQHGTDTLLDCVARPKDTNSKLSVVSWKFNKKTVLDYQRGKYWSEKPDFKFALGSLDDSNMNVSLLITNTKLSHAGDYTCDVVTNTGDADAKVHLEVKSNYSKPEIRSDPTKINPDKRFTLTCTAHGGYPKGDIRWVVDGHLWKMKPEVKVENDPNGLYNLASTLTLEPSTPFRTFVCEVYNAEGVKEGQEEFNYVSSGESRDEPPPSHINWVAPLVVIGSLIVGLLTAILLCRRKRQQARRLSAAPLMNDTPAYPEEPNPLV